jgi:hypothetical protein
MKNLLSILTLCLITLTSNAQDPCASLQIVSVQLNALNSEYITIKVLNESTEIFSYPGFRIYDSDNNLVGEEEVFFFGIGEESVHEVAHSLGDIAAGEEYELTLELWTGFYEEMACSFSDGFILIPEDNCAAINMSLSQLWNTQSEENYLLTINDSEGNEVFSGFYDFPSPDGLYMDEFCLAQGCYEMLIGTDDAMISNTLFVNLDEEFSSVHLSDSAAAGLPVATIPFGIWDSCEATDVGNEWTIDEAPLLYPNPARDWVMLPQDSESVEFYTTQGKKVGTGLAVNRKLDVSFLAPGQYLVFVHQNNRPSRYRLMKF